MKKIVQWSLCLVIGFLVVAAPGCSSTAKVEASSTTTGQELQDLEDARNRGLITEDEYKKQRQKIMNRK
jgi:hypothetical protein